MSILAPIFLRNSTLSQSKNARKSRKLQNNVGSSDLEVHDVSFEYLFQNQIEKDIQIGSIATNSFNNDHRLKLENILDTVFMLGEQLKKNHSFAQLSEYKSAIKNFLILIVDTGYEATRVHGIVNPRTCLQREYSIIKTVNKQLDALVKAVLNEQKEVFTILEKIEEIKGVLIDYMR